MGAINKILGTVGGVLGFAVLAGGVAMAVPESRNWILDEVAKSSNAYKTQVKENDKLKEKQAELIAEQERLIAENEKTKAELATAKQDLAEKQAELVVVTEHKATLLSAVSTIGQTVNAVENETSMETLEVTKTNVLAKYDELNATIENLQAENTNNELTIASLTETQQTLLDCITAIDNKINGTSDATTLENLSTKQANILSQIDNLNGQITSLQTQIESLNAQIETLNARVAELEEQLQNVQTTIDGITVEIEETRAIRLNGSASTYIYTLGRSNSNTVDTFKAILNGDVGTPKFYYYDEYTFSTEDEPSLAFGRKDISSDSFPSDTNISINCKTSDGNDFNVDDLTGANMVFYYADWTLEYDETQTILVNATINLTVYDIWYTAQSGTYYLTVDGVVDETSYYVVDLDTKTFSNSVGDNGTVSTSGGNITLALNGYGTMYKITSDGFKSHDGDGATTYVRLDKTPDTTYPAIELGVNTYTKYVAEDYGSFVFNADGTFTLTINSDVVSTFVTQSGRYTIINGNSIIMENLTCGDGCTIGVEHGHGSCILFRSYSDGYYHTFSFDGHVFTGTAE